MIQKDNHTKFGIHDLLLKQQKDQLSILNQLNKISKCFKSYDKQTAIIKAARDNLENLGCEPINEISFLPNLEPSLEPTKTNSKNQETINHLNSGILI